jgi:CheY-like chemotaxis protein
MLNPMRHEWDMAFVGAAREALVLLAQAPCDVIVSDMRMPGMDGTQLLTQVMGRFPLTVPSSSGYADSSMIRKPGPVHQYLAKPCDAANLQLTGAGLCAPFAACRSHPPGAGGRHANTARACNTLLAVLDAIQDPWLPGAGGDIISRDISMTARMRNW